MHNTKTIVSTAVGWVEKLLGEEVLGVLSFCCICVR